MTRARDIANLGTQAGSGLDASDITTGTMGAVTLGSTVVFPGPTQTHAVGGHILLVCNTHETGITNYVSHTAAWASSHNAASITLKQANAKVLIMYNQCIDIYGAPLSSALVKCFGNLAGAGEVPIEETCVQITNKTGYTEQFLYQAVCSGHVETLSNTAGQVWVVTVNVYEVMGSVYTHIDNDEPDNTRVSNITLMELAV